MSSCESNLRHKLGRLVVAAAATTIVGSIGDSASGGVSIAKVVERNDIDPLSNGRFDDFGIPAINRGPAGASFNLVFEHISGRRESSPNSVYYYQNAAITHGAFTPDKKFNYPHGSDAFLDSTTASVLASPSANSGAFLPAHQGGRGLSFAGERVYSQGVPLVWPPDQVVDFGKPSASQGNVVAVKFDPSSSQFSLVLNNAQDDVLAQIYAPESAGATIGASPFAGTPQEGAVSLRGGLVAFNQGGIPGPGSGYFTIDTNGMTLGVVANDHTPDPLGAAGAKFVFSGQPTFIHRPPAVLGGGAAWTTQNGVYYRNAQVATAPVSVLDKLSNHPAGASFGHHVSAGGAGAVAYEVSTPNGNEIWMNQWGKITRIVGKGDVVGSRQILDVEMGNEALVTKRTTTHG